jgi:hypothetical protein
MVVMYCLLRTYIEDHANNLKIMSRDLSSFEDFVKDQEYYVPFDLKIRNLSTKDSKELVVNFFLRKFILPSDVNDRSVDSVRIRPSYQDIYNYYYNQSKISDSGRGFTVKNWYKTNTDGSIDTDMNTLVPNDTKFFEEPYLKKSATGDLIPNLNSSGKPHLDHNGNIVRLNNFPDVPYVEWDSSRRYYVPAQKRVSEPYSFFDRRLNQEKIATIKLSNGKLIEYCRYNRATDTWEPVLNSDGTPFSSTFDTFGILSIVVGYRPDTGPIYEPYCTLIREVWVANLKISYSFYESNKKIATINIYDWQPYLNKYHVVDDSKYHNKYLKYKAKYIALKQKLNL